MGWVVERGCARGKRVAEAVMGQSSNGLLDGRANEARLSCARPPKVADRSVILCEHV